MDTTEFKGEYYLSTESGTEVGQGVGYFGRC